MHVLMACRKGATAFIESAATRTCSVTDWGDAVTSVLDGELLVPLLPPPQPATVTKTSEI
jgi:hypothetical protein